MTALSEPAHPARIMARVLALLNPYFDKDTPQAVREIEAEDWAQALGQYPFWAIERAARWWKSDANPDRRKRPLEGDIVARVRREMDAINAAKVILSAPPRADRVNRQEHDDRLSPEDQAAMRARMADIGNATLRAMREKIGPRD